MKTKSAQHMLLLTSDVMAEHVAQEMISKAADDSEQLQGALPRALLKVPLTVPAAVSKKPISKKLPKSAQRHRPSEQVRSKADASASSSSDAATLVSSRRNASCMLLRARRLKILSSTSEYVETRARKGGVPSLNTSPVRRRLASEMFSSYRSCG